MASDQPKMAELPEASASDLRISPRRIRLEASSFCQLRCPSCPTTSGLTQQAIGGGFLKFQDFRQIVDFNPQLERIELSNYGEVFLNPELLQILEYAHQKKVTLAIRNGANLNHVREEVIEGLVKYKVDVITCSIDGASQETYKIYRVRGDFDSVIKNIEKINAYKRFYQTDLPHLRWQFVIFGHNEHEIPVARKMAARLGMEFYTKLTWDNSFSPLHDKAFVRSQTEEKTATRAEFEAERGHKYANGICLQLWDDPQINWNGDVLRMLPKFLG